VSVRLVVVAALAAPPASGASVIVGVAGLGTATGDIRIALYADAAGFDARESAFARTVPALVPGVSVVFEDVPPGDYAALVYHDIDADGELRRGTFGIPVEPWTGSTAGSRFRAPSWNAYAFVVAEEAIELDLSF